MNNTIAKPEYVEAAQTIARCAHDGQKRWSGESFIIHPEAVAALVAHLGPEYEATGLLHDVVEDSPTSLADLVRVGMPESVVEAVRLLTKQDGTPYLDYLLALAKNPIARAVKIADMTHNISTCPERNKNAKMKWELARHILENMA